MTDFSNESIVAAYEFVQKAITTQIQSLQNDLAAFIEAQQRDPVLFQMLVITAVQDYRNDPDFQTRWDLKEDKHKHKFSLTRSRLTTNCWCGQPEKHPDHILTNAPDESQG